MSACWLSQARRRCRRAILAGLVATLAAPAAQAATPATNLRDAGIADALYMGTAVEYPILKNGPAVYRTTLAREFCQVTPGNEMKWDTIQPGPTTYDFTKADYIVNWAQANGLAVHGHTLLWHSQNPAWLTNGTFTKDQLLAILRDHIMTVVGHYRGKVVEWDVANEIMGDDGTLRHNLWYNTIGPEYIDDAFQWAHEADPGARLLLNDYNNQGKGRKSDAIYNLVSSMQTRGIPIDGVGFQTHIGTSLASTPSSYNDISWNMARLNVLGLETDITEMDVALKLPSTPADLQVQATGFSGVLNVCMKRGELRVVHHLGLHRRRLVDPPGAAGLRRRARVRRQLPTEAGLHRHARPAQRRHHAAPHVEAGQRLGGRRQQRPHHGADGGAPLSSHHQGCRGAL